MYKIGANIYSKDGVLLRSLHDHSILKHDQRQTEKQRAQRLAEKRSANTTAAAPVSVSLEPKASCESLAPILENDKDHLTLLCDEVVAAGHSVLIFCESKGARFPCVISPSSFLSIVPSINLSSTFFFMCSSLNPFVLASGRMVPKLCETPCPQSAASEVFS